MANIEPSKQGRPALRSRDLLGSLRDEMDRVFEQFDRGWGLPSLFAGAGGAAAVVPQFDIRDDGKSLTIEAELPGVDEKDVTVSLADGVLVVKGEKRQEREEKKDNYYLSERAFGSFERALRMPDWIDDSKVEAHFDKGVLKIMAPKKPDAVKSERQIEIKKPQA
ncbi:MAG: Hsp20/alpha crystallin family protein [Hyphomicrobiaceae bacterium]|nr:Hsp20/alpha crystallin family protein [Hyphomicrobiaceae bacterium]